ELNAVFQWNSRCGRDDIRIFDCYVVHLFYPFYGIGIWSIYKKRRSGLRVGVFFCVGIRMCEVVGGRGEHRTKASQITGAGAAERTGAVAWDVSTDRRRGFIDRRRGDINRRRGFIARRERGINRRRGFIARKEGVSTGEEALSPGGRGYQLEERGINRRRGFIDWREGISTGGEALSPGGRGDINWRRGFIDRREGYQPEG